MRPVSDTSNNGCQTQHHKLKEKVNVHACQNGAERCNGNTAFFQEVEKAEQTVSKQDYLR